MFALIGGYIWSEEQFDDWRKRTLESGVSPENFKKEISYL